MVCFFLSLLKRKLPRRCPKQGGGGEGHFWTMSERKQLFSPDDFPKNASLWNDALAYHMTMAGGAGGDVDVGGGDSGCG